MKKQTFVTNKPGMVEGRQKFEIINRSQNRRVKGLKVDGKEYPYIPKADVFYTEDVGLARQIHSTQGQGGTGDCLVVPVEKNKEPDHVRTFGTSLEFRNAWAAFEARRIDKKE